MQGYLKLKKRSRKYVYYVYLDHKDNLADSLFYRERITVRFMGDYIKKDWDWKFIRARVKKDDEERFIKVLSGLPDKLLLVGVQDYEEALKVMCEIFGNKAMKDAN